MDFKENLKKFHAFLKSDSWASFFVTLIISLIFIKFIFFPILTLITGSPLPLVIVESCSMYHSDELLAIVQNPLYNEYNVNISTINEWPLKSGFNKGDIILVLGPKNIGVGDVIIFNAGQRNPIIHRVIGEGLYGYATKGDNNWGQLPYEKQISPDQLVGKAALKIPLLGWVKLIFFDFQKPISERGFCK